MLKVFLNELFITLVIACSNKVPLNISDALLSFLNFGEKEKHCWTSQDFSKKKPYPSPLPTTLDEYLRKLQKSF